ncbi:hypothetical protein [Pseudogemmobacter sonorensis]|uniref:hypothetical protein n=1 Tax=Pseudogemmobacter sonorensis TaxID=2989681 RepID=UPI0036B925E8
MIDIAARFGRGESRSDVGLPDHLGLGHDPVEKRVMCHHRQPLVRHHHRGMHRGHDGGPRVDLAQVAKQPKLQIGEAAALAAAGSGIDSGRNWRWR